MAKLADEQEVMGAIADMIIEVFAMESAILRAEKMSAASSGKGSDAPTIPVAMARIYADRPCRSLNWPPAKSSLP